MRQWQPYKISLNNKSKHFLCKNENNENILTSNRRHPIFLISNRIRGEIHKFFERDDVSRMCPGKKIA